MSFNFGMFFALTGLFTFLLWMLQRTDAKFLWVTALILVAPVAYLLYDWASFNGWQREMLIGLGISILLNVIYWALIGRHRPPRSDSITVIGMDD